MRITFRLSIILIIFSCTFNAVANDNSYRQVFDYIRKCNWTNAENLAKQKNDRALLKIVLSQAFLSTSYKNTSFDSITNFLKKNPKWPQNDALKIKAEGLIDDSTDKAQLYDWFKKNAPKTGNGHKYYALSAAQILKDPDKLTPIVKNGWIYGCFSQEQQSSFLSKFKKHLTLQDNVNRIDNLLWKGSTSAAKKSFNLVTPGYRKAFEAQIAFIESHKDAYRLFKNVPKEYYTQGLVYQYISSRKSDLPSVKEMVGLINLVKHNKGHEGDFWKLQCYLAREYIQNKQFNDAYAIATSHFALSPANSSDAEFLSGWLALRFLNKPQAAIGHFKKFNKIVKTPMSIARGLYWLARSYDASGNTIEAKKLYEQVAHEFGYTFYGQVGTMELGMKKLRLPPKVTLANHKNDNYTKNNDILKAANIVSKYGSNGLAQIYLDALVNSTEEEQEILAMALEMQHSKLHHRVWMSKNAIQKHVFIDHYSYPTPYKTAHLPTEEALTYSIIRQESVFDQHAKSSAEAMGLMQLIKTTACETAKKIAYKCEVHSLTKDPNYNITLGSSHLSQMIGKYQDSYILAIAAYNAGAGNINKWLKLYGDPRNLKDPHKILDWIEIIPFAETRNYVQRVLENIQIYRVILDKNAKFDLKNDLVGW